VNDETRTGFTAGSGFAADDEFSDDSEFEEASSFSAGSVRFKDPTGEFPAVGDFALSLTGVPAKSGYSAESELSSELSSEPEDAAEEDDTAEPEVSAEPADAAALVDTAELKRLAEPADAAEAEDTDEPEPLAEPLDVAEPEAADWLGGYAEPEPEAEVEQVDAAEPEAAAELATAEPEDIAEPEPEPLAVREPFSSFERFSGPTVTVEPEVPAEPEYRARAEFSDVFARPSFFGGPAYSTEPEPPAEPADTAMPEAEPEPEPPADSEPPAEPAASEEPAYPSRSEFSDFFTRRDYRSRSELSDVFSRPASYAKPEISAEPKVDEEPRYFLPAEPRYSASQAAEETRFPAWSAPAEPESYARPREEPRSYVRPVREEPGSYARPASGEPRSYAQPAPEEPGSYARPASGEPRSYAQPAPEEPEFHVQPAAQEEPAPATWSAPAQPRLSRWPALEEPRFTPRPAGEPAEAVTEQAVPEPEAPAKAGPDAEAEVPEPAVTVEVPGKPAAQHPVRTTSELSVLRPPEPPAEIDARPQDGLWAYESYPVVQNVPPADDQAGVVSLGYIGAAMKRNKKIWCLTTVLGILLAGGLYNSYHPTYSNTTAVLLALDPSLDPNTAIQTDAILADDSTVAQLTMNKLDIHESVPTFQKTYTVAVSTTSNNLLTFTATAATATAAYNEANTLANTFLQYRAQTELEKESANTAGQVQQVTQTQQTINSINNQIKKLKADGALPGDSRLTRLQNQLTSAQNLLTSLQQTVASTEAGQRSTTAGLIAGSSVIDTGIPAEGHSKKKFALEYGGASIFGGLVLGLLIVAIGAIVSDRLRRRDDVAAALGAPVRVSVASGGRKRSRNRGREADLKRVAAHLLGAVPGGSDGAGSLVVVAVDDKTFAAEAIRQAAVTAAHEGKRAVVADLAGGALGGLFGSKEPGIRPVDIGGVRVVLVTPEPGDLAPVGPLHAPSLGTPMNGVQGVHAAADLFITLATVNPATGGAHLKTWADDAVAVVTAGESSVTRVQAVGEMIRFAGARLDSAVLLGADEKDESLGFVTA